MEFYKTPKSDHTLYECLLALFKKFLKEADKDRTRLKSDSYSVMKVEINYKDDGIWWSADYINNPPHEYDYSNIVYSLFNFSEFYSCIELLQQKHASFFATPKLFSERLNNWRRYHFSEVEKDKEPYIKALAVLAKSILEENEVKVSLPLLKKKIASFISDLNDAPTTCNIEIWVKGIYLEKQSFQINDQTLIRRPTGEDIAKIYKELIFSDMQLVAGEHSPTAIIELKGLPYLGKGSIEELEILVEEFITLLRLLKNGSAFKLKHKISPDGILRPQTNVVPDTRTPCPFRSEFTRKDVRKLNLLLDKIQPILKTQGNKSLTDAINIGLHRYENALILPGEFDSRITSAINGLEALFLQENSELTHRLSQRVAAFLRHPLKINALQIYEDTKLAYSIRSKFIHGSMTKRQKDEILLCKRILRYTSSCLILMFQLKNSIKKDDLLKLIDTSLLEQEHDKKLKLLLKNIIVI